MSISLITVAEGEAYAQFVPRWWDSVVNMNPQPDEVIIVIGRQDKAGVLKVITGEVKTNIIILDEPFSNNYFQRGFQAATSEWVAFCGVDDIMLPGAYRDVQAATEAGADIIVGSIIMSNGTIWKGKWDIEALQHNNTIPAHSPYKKQLWLDMGGWPAIHWNDWGFWLKCAHHGIKTFQGTDLIAIFDLGEGRETQSGVGLDPVKRAKANAELHAYRATLTQPV